MPSHWTFTQGLLVGATAVLILVVLAIKYVLFQDVPTPADSKRPKRAAREKASGVGVPSPSSADLLAALNYDLSAHPSESLDWLNLVVAQTLSAYRTLIAGSPRGPAAMLEDVLNRGLSGPPGQEEAMFALGKVEVAEVHLGDKYPLLSSARVRPSSSPAGSASSQAGLRVEMDLDYTDSISFSISTDILVNFPRPRFAVLPISLSLTLAQFSGTLTIELPPPLSPRPSGKSSSREQSAAPNHPKLELSLLPDFEMHITTASLIGGSRAKLVDLPKVEQLLLARIRAWVVDRYVWPKRVALGLPGVGRQAPEAQQGEEWEVVHHSVADDESLPKDTTEEEEEEEEEEEGLSNDYNDTFRQMPQRTTLRRPPHSPPGALYATGRQFTNTTTASSLAPSASISHVAARVPASNTSQGAGVRYRRPPSNLAMSQTANRMNGFEPPAAWKQPQQKKEGLGLVT